MLLIAYSTGLVDLSGAVLNSCRVLGQFRSVVCNAHPLYTIPTRYTNESPGCDSQLGDIVYRVVDDEFGHGFKTWWLPLVPHVRPLFRSSYLYRPIGSWFCAPDYILSCRQIVIGTVNFSETLQHMVPSCLKVKVSGRENIAAATKPRTDQIPVLIATSPNHQ